MNFHGSSKILPGWVVLRDDHGKSFIFKLLGVKETRRPLDAMHELFHCIKPNIFQGV